MESHRFDDLTRSLAARPTRRGLLGTALALVAGALGLGDVRAQPTLASCGNVICRSNPGKCANGCVCCVAPNGNSRCAPPGQCSWGRQVCPPERPHVDRVRGCIGCRTAADCPPSGDACRVATCTGGVCGVAAPASGTGCRTASCLDGMATEAATCAGTACPAPVTRECAPYACSGTVCATTCSGDSGCVAGYHCDGSVCVADVAAGQGCDEASDCTSGFCVDGICCDSACAGACETCTGATPGVCSAVVCPGVPGGACVTSNGVCNPANGNCEVVFTNVAQGTPCDGGTSLDCVSYACDGAGACVEATNECHPDCLLCDQTTGNCVGVVSQVYPKNERVTCALGKGICVGEGFCYLPCGPDCTEHCYERFVSGSSGAGFFCCADNLDRDGNCCWQFDQYGILDDQLVCHPAINPCCNPSDPCCPPGSSCSCSFGRISSCC